MNDASNSNPFRLGAPPDDATLLAYAEGRLSAAEQHAVERWLAAESPEAEALEGLQGVPAGETRRLTARINGAVRQRMGGERRPRRGKVVQQRWLLLAVLCVLLLAVLAFLVIRLASR